MKKLWKSISLSICLIGFSVNHFSYASPSHSEQENQTITSQDLPWVDINQVNSGQLLFSTVDTGKYYQAPMLDTQVNMQIQGIVANTQLHQTFTNTTQHWQHAVYAFPLPDDAAINHLTIKLTDREIIGEIKRKEQAKKIFEQAKKSGKRAALLEQKRPNLFTTKIANIAPGESITVELSYFQASHFDNGQFSLHYPLAITPRYIPNPNSAGNNQKPVQAQTEHEQAMANLTQDDPLSPSLDEFQAPAIGGQLSATTDINIQLSAGAELALLNSQNHLASIQEISHGEFAINLKDLPPSKDFKLVWAYKNTALPQTVHFQQTYQDKAYGLMMLLPGTEDVITEQASIKRQLTFVLDTSGSMSGESILQAKQAFKYALSTLRADDTFQVVQFNSFASQLFDHPVLATTENKQQAWQHVNMLTAQGGTEIASTLALVLNQPNQPDRLEQIVFITDGSVGNEAQIFKQINQQLHHKRLFTVGIGSAPNRYFMSRAAEAGRGTYHYIASSQQVKPEMDKLFNKLANPALTDIKLQLSQNDLDFNYAPNPINDLYQGEPIFINYQYSLNNQAEPVQFDGILSANLQGQPWAQSINFNVEHTGEIEQPNFSKAAPALATLWARKKISDLNRELMLGGDKSVLGNNITELGLKFNLVTPFTSFVAVEKQISRPQHSQAQQKQLPSPMLHKQRLPQTALGWQWQFYTALIVLILSSAIAMFFNPKVNNAK